MLDVLESVYGKIDLQSLQIVLVLSATRSPFFFSTGKPKWCHTRDLKEMGASSISMLSVSVSIFHELAPKCQQTNRKGGVTDTGQSADHYIVQSAIMC